MNKLTHQKGFTLIEVLISSLVFSVLAIMAYSALNNMLRLDQHQQQQFAREGQLRQAWGVIFSDFIQVRDRSVRDQYGDVIRPYLGEDAEYVVEFSRGGMPVYGQSPSAVARIAYQFEDSELRRLVWPIADRGEDTEPRQQVLVAGLRDFSVEHLGPDNRFGDQWPPLNQAAGMVPRMVRLKLELESGEQLERVIPLLEFSSWNRGRNNG
ncbi:MAG: type II secretion system minor pseudopilin GspJ [Pseudomonadales bacterium]